MTLLTNKTLLSCTLALAMDASFAAAAPDCIDLHGAAGQRLDLVRGKSVLKRFCTPAAQVTVGAPEVANVVVPNASEVVIVARSVGSTNLIMRPSTASMCGSVTAQLIASTRRRPSRTPCKGLARVC